MRDHSLSQTASDLADTQPSRHHNRREGGPNRALLETLLERARTARDGDEALEYMQRAVNLRPDDPRVQSTAQLSVFRKLRSDAFLAFLAETDRHYVITFRHSRPFAVPKARASAEPYPPTVPRTEAERAPIPTLAPTLGPAPTH